MDAEDAPRTFFARYAALPMLVLYNVHLVPALARLIVSEAGRMHEGADLAAPKIVIIGASVRLPELETVAERNSNVRMFRMRTLSQGEITADTIFSSGCAFWISLPLSLTTKATAI